LSEVADTWTGTTWFVEGDVADFFGPLDHQVLLAILAEQIRDNRFLRLMRYIRYVDDILLGFAGPKHEAEEIEKRLTRFMREELRLDLSQEKTPITHARTRAARFLGYEITTQTGTGGRKNAEGGIRLRVPIPVIKSSCATYLRGGKPAAQRALQNLHDRDIVSTFGTRYRGIVNYYLLAADGYRLERVRWTMQTSMLKTLAGKHKSSVAKMSVRAALDVGQPRRVLRVGWGGADQG
jgi:hypothetical protein